VSDAIDRGKDYHFACSTGRRLRSVVTDSVSTPEVAAALRVLFICCVESVRFALTHGRGALY
jgi:hypothetical protein